jgi:hypothetical protein
MFYKNLLPLIHNEDEFANFFLLTGLMEIFRRIPTIQELRLDEATEHTRDPLKTTASFTFVPQGESNKHPLKPAETEPGPAERSFPEDASLEEIPHGSHSSLSSAPKRKKGIKSPQDLPSIRKYGETVPVNVLAETIRTCVIGENWKVSTGNLAKIFAKLIGGSLASKTWKKYASAWNAWEKFMSQHGGGGLEFTQQKSWAFLCWCKKEEKLKAETVKQYLGAIEKVSDLLATLQNSENSGTIKREGNFKKILLTGYKNMEKCKGKHKPVKPINLTILHQIQRNLSNTMIGRGSRLAIWAASLLAFWGSFRLAEILPSRRLAFDTFLDLLWNDIHWKKESFLLDVKQPKISNGWSDKVEIFQISSSRFCPVHALKKLKHYWKRKDRNYKCKPVFRTFSGKILTKGKFLSTIRRGLQQSEKPWRQITGKSFRSGLASELENFSNTFKKRHIKILGRWKSNAYQRYIRKFRKEKNW